MLLHDLLLHAERTSGRRAAIIDGSVERNYAEVADRVRRAAAVLRLQGLAPGQHVAILAANSGFFYEAYFACSMAGLVAVPVNTRLSAVEIAFILDDSQCHAVLYDDSCQALVPSADGRVHIAATAWDRLLDKVEPSAPADDAVGEDSLAHICYTGGTTGRPKGVMLSHRNVVSSAFNKIVLGGFARNDVWLHAAPMFHQADSWATFAFTALGAAHVFMPRFDPDAALQLIEQHRVTALQLVPTMLVLMLETGQTEAYDLSRIRRVLYGSAPMPVQTLRRCQAVFGDVFQHIYGLTEAAGTVAATPWPAPAGEIGGERLASCGQPLAGVRLRIVGDDDELLPADHIGRIQVRGATVMRGYWQRPHETAAAFVEGWLDTGDIGRMDRDGFVFIVDRAKDMIITGGENVYSTEVENVLHEHPSVLEAAVIGLPDSKWGEAVTAVVAIRAGEAVSAQSVQDHCRARLAGYKCPKRVVLRQTLPKTPAGKIAKAVLRDELSSR